MKTTKQASYLLSALIIVTCVSPLVAETKSTRVIGGATVSARLVSELFSRPVEQTTAIRENLMGAATRGTAWTEGNVQAEFLPNASAAVVND